MPAKPTWHPWIPSSHFAPGGLADGLVGAWFALEGAGTLAHDLSRHGNHGTFQIIQDGIEWAIGRDGPVLRFTNEGTDRVSTGGWNITGSQFTIFASIELAAISVNARDAILAKWDNTTDKRSFELVVGLLNGTGNVALAVSDNGSNFIVKETADNAVSLDTTTVAAVYNAGTFAIYVDGVEQSISTAASAGSAVTGAPDSNDTDVRIGNVVADGGATSPFNGDISAVIMSEAALPAADIRTLHHDPYALLRPVRRWWAVALEVDAEPPAFVPQTYTADVLVNPSPTVSVDANPSPSIDLESNPSPTVEVESG